MAYTAKGMRVNELWNLDLGATTHCMGDVSSFNALDPYNGTLSTVSMSTPIIRQGMVRAHLSNHGHGSDCIAKLGGVKYIPGM